MNMLIIGLLLFLSDELKNKAVTSFENAEAKILNVAPTPDPEPQKECPCKGTGVITHGDGHKTACPGINGEPCKFRKTGDSPKEVVNGLIIMESRPGCMSCDRIENSQFLKDLTKVGWKFQKVNVDDNLPVPRLYIIMNNERNRITDLKLSEIVRINNKYKKGK